MILKNSQNAYTELDWREELIKVPRTPRPSWKSVEKLLSSSRGARISLHERNNYTDIVLRFPGSSRQLPSKVQKAYSQLGMGLPAVFEEVIWKRPEKGSSTLWSDLMRVGYKAYRDAWLHSQELVYLSHFHPKADAILREDLNELRNATRLSVGRRQALAQEKQSRYQRFLQLLEVAKEIHEIVENCVKNGLDKSVIRKAVFHKIHGNRIDDFILRHDRGQNKSPFERIPYEKRGRIVCLHDPTSWRPNQLAKALLSLEREFEYKTIEREIAITREQEKLKKNNPNK